MARIRYALLLVLPILATPAEACMRETAESETAEGRLSIENARDAAGRRERPFIVTLSKPACLTAEDPEMNVESSRTIHVYSIDDGIRARISRLVGSTVRVTGRVFAAHTAHHHAPIMMDVTAIEKR